MGKKEERKEGGKKRKEKQNKLIISYRINSEHLHLIVTVFGFLHPVSLRQFFIKLSTGHATIWRAT